MSRHRYAFTVVELLVVIAIIIAVLAIVVPMLGTVHRGRGLANAGSMIKAAATKARSRAIATRDVQHMLIFIGDGTDNPITHQVDPVSDPNAPSKSFTSTRNTIVIVDENARATANNYGDWLLKVDEPMVLPKHSEFVKGTGANRYPDVIQVHFYSDGSLILVNQPDKPGTNLKKDESFYDDLLDSGESADWPANFDLAVKNPPFTSVCLIDFVSNSGTVEYLVFPK